MEAAEASVSEYAEGLAEHAARLAAAAALNVMGDPSDRDSEVKRILARNAELVRGAATLGHERNVVVLGVISRTIIESLITLLWVVRSEENAQHHAAAGKAEFKRVANLNMRRGALKILNRETGEDATDQFLDSDRCKNLLKPKRVIDMAQEAGVEELYEVFYRFMSMATHGHDLGANDKADVALIIEMQGIGAMSMAMGHAGVRWLLDRQHTDNKTLQKLLGLDGLG